jgi:hypothetical protein
MHRADHVESGRARRFRKSMRSPPEIPGGSWIPCFIGGGKPKSRCDRSAQRRGRGRQVPRRDRRGTGDGPAGRGGWELSAGAGISPARLRHQAGTDTAADMGPGPRRKPVRDRSTAGRHSRPAARGPPGPTRPGSDGCGTWKTSGDGRPRGIATGVPSVTTGRVGAIAPTRPRPMPPAG